ncbi:alpha/beta-hydrolase [Clavulina sp. PMI_390]|nr:alpha/beta-hydrolase [Clavulina sp. PMI_390]
MSSSELYAPSEFEVFDVTLPARQDSPSVVIHGVSSKSSTTASSKPPLLLLHGHPQTHHIWHKVAPALSKSFHLVIPDLRGYGASSKPMESDPEHKLYSKREMGEDQVALMKHFGFDKFYVVSHDRGARVAHRLALDHPELVLKLVILDIAPTLAMYEKTDQRFASYYWHWFFLIQPSPLPEEFIMRSPDTYMRRAIRAPTSSTAASESPFAPAAVEFYMANASSPEGVHGMCEDYRASAPGGIDLRLDAADREAGRKIACPVLVLWGGRGVIELCFDALAEWNAVSEKAVVGKALPTGHYIPEEMDSAELVKEITQFIGAHQE